MSESEWEADTESRRQALHKNFYDSINNGDYKTAEKNLNSLVDTALSSNDKKTADSAYDAAYTYKDATGKKLVDDDTLYQLEKIMNKDRDYNDEPAFNDRLRHSSFEG